MRLLRVRFAIILAVSAVLTLAAPPCRAGGLKILYAFQGGTDGTNPLAGVIAQGGALFGTTEGGGNSGCGGFGCGTVFRVDVATGVEKVLDRFADSPDAALPAAPLLRRGQVLYGTTIGGGTMFPGQGAVFAVDQHSGAETVLGSLGGALGYHPFGGLAFLAGGLFGTTELGGTGSGTVFQTDPSGGVHVVYTFRGSPKDGVAPWGNLVPHDGVLFGTTYEGGHSGYGTVFQLDPTTGREKVLHNFQNQDGALPTGLIYDKGQLFGVTAGGGNASCPLGCGTVFRIDLKTNAFSTLYEFNGGAADGESPDSVVLLNGVLYGTTGVGGPAKFLCEYGCGTLFQYNPATRTERVQKFFRKLADGYFPEAVTVSDGTLYGTTEQGGAATCENGSGCGVVFAFTP